MPITLLDTLEGIIERITFRAEDTGYTVAKLQPARGRKDLITIVGAIPQVTPGENVRLEGEWSTHPQYGRQFKIHRYRTVYPSTIQGIRKYLGSGLIKGIGPVTAGRIVQYFGLDTLRIIEEEPSRLIEVEGLGPKRAAMIQRAWEEQREIKEVMLFLQSHDISTSYAVKIWKQYGEQAIPIVRDNPYRLASEVWGIGFLTADRIAQNMGVKPDSEDRIKAGIRYVLSQACEEEGHVYLPLSKLVSQSAANLKVPEERIPPCIEALSATRELIVENDRGVLPVFYHSEKGSAEKLHLLSQIARVERKDVPKEITAIERRQGLIFAERQREAMIKALTHHLLVLTGGPGTGKTTTILGMIHLFEQRGKRIALAAPTGRAAKRMGEVTGREAKTIHRLLKFNPRQGGFEHNADNPLDIDVLIVDETSMIDILLMYHLLRAIRPLTTLILVGDVDQLPSVGPGNILRDLIASGQVETVRLEHIFRQAEQSWVVVNAHRINRGEFPLLRNDPGKDFFFIEEEDPARVAAQILDLCAERLPGRYGFHPIEDIQVLSPMYRGETGAIHLNQQLQERLNPIGQRQSFDEIQRGGMTFRVGDKVMQIRNNYAKEVFNGDIGRIVDIDREVQEVRIVFGEEVTYEFSELDEVVLAYAVSVHKSQGSEYRAVVLPLTTQHYMMLQRNLLYTAVTRAKELMVIVGTKKALGMAIRNNKVAERYTALSERLVELSSQTLDAPHG